MPEVLLPGLIQVSHGAFDALWRLADGRAALLYLFVLRHNRMPQSHEAEQAGLNGEDLAAARKVLEKEGLLAVSAAPERLQESPPPSYSAKDIAEGLRRDTGFAYVTAETQRLMGRVLSSGDLTALYTIYDWRGLPADVLLMLIRYCLHDYRERYGPDARPPSLSQIDREARLWADAEIFTHEAAERYIQAKEQSRNQTARMLAVLGISGRAASATERKYINAWIAMGFPRETVALAYDRTVIFCGRMNWKYCDKVLKNWHEAGLHTPREVEEGDTKPPRARTPHAAPGMGRERSNRPVMPPGEAEFAAMERMMNRGRKGRESHDGAGTAGTGGT